MAYKTDEYIKATGPYGNGNYRAFDEKTGKNGYVSSEGYFIPDEPKSPPLRSNAQESYDYSSDISSNVLDAVDRTVLENPGKDFKRAVILGFIIFGVFLLLFFLGFIWTILASTFLGFPLMTWIYIQDIKNAEQISGISYVHGGIIILEIIQFIRYVIMTLTGRTSKNLILRFAIVFFILQFAIYMYLGYQLKFSLLQAYQMIGLPTVLLYFTGKLSSKKHQ